MNVGRQNALRPVVVVPDLVLPDRAREVHRVVEAECSDPRLDHRSQRAGTDEDGRGVEAAAPERRERVDQHQVTLLGIEPADAQDGPGRRRASLRGREHVGIDAAVSDVEPRPHRRIDLPHQLGARVLADADHEVGGGRFLTERMLAFVDELVPTVDGHAPRPRRLAFAAHAVPEGGGQPCEVARSAGEVRVDVPHPVALAVLPEDERLDEVEDAPETVADIRASGAQTLEEGGDERAGVSEQG